MKVRRDESNLRVQFILFCFVVVYWCPKSSQAYENYTVGDSFGWYDNTEKPQVNYQKWADAKNFSLGDFLIFNTNTNHSVIQTNNATTYKLCDSSDTDAVQWSAGNPSNTATEPVTVFVPLRKEGKTFFFSGDYDGDQCFKGQRFSISVSHGQGLPRDPEAPGPAEGPSDGGGDDNDESAPETNVPANFDHPKPVKDSGDNSSDDGDNDGDKRSSSSNSFELYRSRVGFFLVVVVLLWLGA